nr:hypothetical protein [Staphylococcus hyicus]
MLAGRLPSWLLASSQFLVTVADVLPGVYLFVIVVSLIVVE